MSSAWRSWLVLVVYGLLAACTNELPASDDGGSPPSGGGAAAGAPSGGTSGAAQGGGGAQVGQGGTSQGGATGCGGPATLASVTAATLYAELQEPDRSFLLIDVRPQPGAQIPGTDTNISANDTAALEAYIGSDKSRAVTIYCQAGHLVLIAGPALVADGYCNVRYLVGGIDAWQTAGYSVTQ